MNDQSLQKATDALELDGRDIHAIKKERSRERWIYPVITVIVGSLSALIGWLGARDNERLVSRETGDEYPFCGGSGGVIRIGLIGSLIGVGSFTTFLELMKQGKLTSRKRAGIFAGFMLALALIVIAISYQLSRPVEYYSGSIEYGVYSQTEEVVHE